MLYAHVCLFVLAGGRAQVPLLVALLAPPSKEAARSSRCLSFTDGLSGPFRANGQQFPASLGWAQSTHWIGLWARGQASNPMGAPLLSFLPTRLTLRSSVPVSMMCLTLPTEKAASASQWVTMTRRARLPRLSSYNFWLSLPTAACRGSTSRGPRLASKIAASARRVSQHSLISWGKRHKNALFFHEQNPRPHPHPRQDAEKQDTADPSTGYSTSRSMQHVAHLPLWRPQRLASLAKSPKCHPRA